MLLMSKKKHKLITGFTVPLPLQAQLLPLEETREATVAREMLPLLPLRVLLPLLLHQLPQEVVGNSEMDNSEVAKAETREVMAKDNVVEDKECAESSSHRSGVSHRGKKDGVIISGVGLGCQVSLNPSWSSNVMGIF